MDRVEVNWISKLDEEKKIRISLLKKVCDDNHLSKTDLAKMDVEDVRKMIARIHSGKVSVEHLKFYVDEFLTATETP